MSGPPPPVPPPFESNYPRQQMTMLGNVRPPGVYFDTIGTAWEMLKAGWQVYLPCTLLATAVIFGLGMLSSLVLFPVIFQSMSFGSTSFPSLSPGVVLIMGAINYVQTTVQAILLTGLVSVGVEHARGQYPSISDMFLPFHKFGTLFGAIFIFALPYSILEILPTLLMRPSAADPFAGLALSYSLASLRLLLLAILIGPILLAFCAAARSDLGVLGCYSEAFRRLGWRFPLFSILAIVSLIVGSVGAFACLVGVLFTFPIFSNVLALHYLYFFPPSNPQMTEARLGGRWS